MLLEEALAFAAGWLSLFWLGCGAAVLLPASFAVVLAFELFPDDWAAVLLGQSDPLVVGAGGEGFACAPASCCEAAASSKAENG